MEKCIKCKGENLDSGLVVTAGIVMSGNYDSTLYYESLNKKILYRKTDVNAMACLDCGHVELVLDNKHLKSSIKKS